jgi:hypothetical protein
LAPRAINTLREEASSRIPRFNLIVRKEGPFSKLWGGIVRSADSLKSRVLGVKNSDDALIQALEKVGVEEITEAPRGLNKNAIIGTGVALAGSWAAYELLRNRHESDKTISR